MQDIKKTKSQLLTELTVLRQRVVELEKSQIEQTPHNDTMRASEEWYRLLFDNVSDAVFVHWGPDATMIPGTFIEANDVACQRLGYTREELLQMSPHDIDAPETISGIPMIMERLLKEKRVLWEGVHISKDGRRIPVEIHNCLFYSKGKSVILSTVRDITERQLAEAALQRAHDDLERLVLERTSELLMRNEQLKEVVEKYRQTEESLKASEERYRSVVDHIGIGISLISPDMEILTLNNQMKKWFPNIDVSKRPICYKSFNNPPREEICSYCPTYTALQDGQVHESVTETPAGTEIKNYRIISSPIKDMDGKIIAAIEMVDDITEKKKMQETLQESETKYRSIFETTTAATMIIEENTTISLVNTEFEKLSGYSKEEIEGRRSWTEFIVKDDLPKMKEYHRLRRIDPNAAPRNYEFGFIDRNGGIRDAFMTISMMPRTTISVASLLDITDRKRAEEALKKRERELEVKSCNLEEMNTTLRVLLNQRENDKNELEEKILVNVKQLAMPYIEKLKKSSLNAKETDYVSILESNLKNIISPFASKLSSQYLNLTPKEIQIADLIKEGKTTKEVGELLNVSPGTVTFHRKNIRIKFNLKNKKDNLRSYLLTLS